MTRIFAFGTLKKGFPLHCRGMGGARYLGACKTVERFPLVVAGRWFAPMMLNLPGNGLRVAGELYEVGQAGLERLDALESVGVPGNFRVEVRVEPSAGGSWCCAFAYMKAPALAKPIHSAFLDDYQDRRFVPPEQRQD